MTRTNTALISGAGIAGPALAYWLHTYGWTVIVVESAPGIRPGGQTVDLRGAGRTVVEKMHLMPVARAASLDQKGITWVDAAGRHRAEMPVDAFGGHGIVSEIEILRGDLAGLLYTATADHAEYLFGTRITALTGTADAVTATLSDGTTRTVDLVVGADGPHSAVRRMAFGPEERFVRPVGGYTAWFTAPSAVGTDGWYEMFQAPGGLVASIRPDRDPATMKASLAFASKPLVYDRDDLDAQRRLIAERFAGAGWHVPVLVDAARAADDFYLDAIVQVHMDHWSRDRVVLRPGRCAFWAVGGATKAHGCWPRSGGVAQFLQQRRTLIDGAAGELDEQSAGRVDKFERGDRAVRGVSDDTVPLG